MNLDELKKQFQIKYSWILILLISGSIIWLIVSIIMAAMDSSEFNQAFLIASVSFFVFILIFWLIWYYVVYDKKRKQQIEYLYGKFANTHNLQFNRTYRVLPISNIQKNYLKKSPFYKYTYPYFYLYMISQESNHACYQVNFMQSTGKSAYIKSAGLVYAYPSSSGITPESIIKDISIEGFTNKVKYSEYGEQYLIYLEMNKQIPIYRRFIDKESEKIIAFAQTVFQFVDQCSDLTR